MSGIAGFYPLLWVGWLKLVVLNLNLCIFLRRWTGVVSPTDSCSMKVDMVVVMQYTLIWGEEDRGDKTRMKLSLDNRLHMSV